MVRSVPGVLDPVEDRLQTRWHSCLVNLDRVSSALALDSNLVLKSVCSRLSGSELRTATEKKSAASTSPPIVLASSAGIWSVEMLVV